MGKYFTSTQNIFTSQRRVKMWRESKISFPYTTISDLFEIFLNRLQYKILLATRALQVAYNINRTIWENTERSRDAEIFK